MTHDDIVHTQTPKLPADEVVGKIIEIVDVLNETELGDLSEDTLSRVALKLASYKATLGTYVAQAHAEEYTADAEYYEKRAQSYQDQRDEGKGSTDANELKHLAMKEAMDKQRDAKSTYERLNKLHGDCKEMIETIRSQIIRLQTERKEASHGF